jgi:hypothetical protein
VECDKRGASSAAADVSERASCGGTPMNWDSTILPAFMTYQRPTPRARHPAPRPCAPNSVTQLASCRQDRGLPSPPYHGPILTRLVVWQSLLMPKGEQRCSGTGKNSASSPPPLSPNWDPSATGEQQRPAAISFHRRSRSARDRPVTFSATLGLRRLKCPRRPAMSVR